MAIQQFYTPQKNLYSPKQISGYAPAEYIDTSVLFYYLSETGNALVK